MKYGISSGLPDLPAGLKDPDYNLVAPIYRAVNALAGAVAVQTGSVQYSTAELSGVNPVDNIRRGSLTQRIPIKAGEALSYGHLVYLQSDGAGKFTAYKADASTGKAAVACVDSPGGIALNGWGEAVFMTGVCSGIAGTTIGTQYYLSTGGLIQADMPTATGVLVQPVGIGLGTQGLYLNTSAIYYSSGGGAVLKLPGGKVIPNFTLTNSSAASNFISDTNPANWNIGPGAMTLQFELVSTNYYAANPSGHWAIAMRQDPALIATDPAGVGIASGNATGFPGGASSLNPTTLIETFAKNPPNLPTGDNFLWPASEVARAYPLADGARYRYIITSTVTPDGAQYIRYRMWRKQVATGEWRAEVDTGDVLDHNNTYDASKTGILFAHVFASNLTAWSLSFENIRVTWDASGTIVPDVTTKLSRFGAELAGDINFAGLTPRSFRTDAASFDIKVSTTVPVANVSAYGFLLNGASYRIGTPTVTYTNMTNWGGSQARAFTDATVLDIDNICTSGTIRTYMSSTPTNVEVEVALRPLYCIVSSLVSELKLRKVI